MAVLSTTLDERVDSISPATMSVSLKDARATWPMIASGPTIGNLETVLGQILGSVNTRAGKGGLNRILPLAHPVMPWLFASSISSIRGIGKPSQSNSNPGLEVAPWTGFALYPKYEFVVEFTPRPYPCLTDGAIPLKLSQTWYKEDGTVSTTGTTFAQEWLRFTDYQVHPSNEALKAQQGQMLFRTQSGAAPGGNPFMDMPKMRLPDQVVKLVWFQVPYRYISSANSYIQKYVGYINQTDWYDWKKGQLLYIGYKPTRYTPPIPTADVWANGTYASQKWCDIEFTFLATNRTATDAITPSNANWIASGWNLQPWYQTRKYYYPTSYDPSNTSDNTKWQPAWVSVPFQLLFTDPDAI